MAKSQPAKPFDIIRTILDMQSAIKELQIRMPVIEAPTSSVADADFASYGVTQATFTNVTNAWPILGNDALAGTTYRLTTAGLGTWGTGSRAGLTLACFAFGISIAPLQISAAQFVASQVFNWQVTADIVVQAPGNPATIKSSLTAVLGVGSSSQETVFNTAGAAGGFVSYQGLTTADTVDPGTVGLQAEWSVNTVSATITSEYSYLERLGP